MSAADVMKYYIEFIRWRLKRKWSYPYAIQIQEENEVISSTIYLWSKAVIMAILNSDYIRMASLKWNKTLLNERLL